MDERLKAVIDFAMREIQDIDSQIASREREIEALRERRLRIEEEGVEARVVLGLVRDSGLKVERRADDGILVASVHEQTKGQEAVQ